MILRYFICLILVWSCTYCAQSQEEIFDGQRHRLAFNTGHGSQDFLAVDYYYQVRIYQFEYYYALLQKQDWSLELFMQPQLNITEYRRYWDSPAYSDGMEYGINAGILIRKNFLDDWMSIYFLGSVGPHYISGAPKRQSSGFLFSDSAFLGASVRVIDKVFFDLRFGIRHISNMGFRLPNRGLNNLVTNSGFYFIF